MDHVRTTLASSEVSAAGSKASLIRAIESGVRGHGRTEPASGESATLKSAARATSPAKISTPAEVPSSKIPPATVEAIPSTKAAAAKSTTPTPVESASSAKASNATESP